jgi:hypothetical protein
MVQPVQHLPVKALPRTAVAVKRQAHQCEHYLIHLLAIVVDEPITSAAGTQNVENPGGKDGATVRRCQEAEARESIRPGATQFSGTSRRRKAGAARV